MFLTYLGLIPFYINPFLQIDNLSVNYEFSEKIKEISYIYGALIVAFLSGMQWQKLIIEDKKDLLLIPFLPLILVISFDLDSTVFIPELVIILALFLSLLIDLYLLKGSKKNWFKKTRIKATILASISYLL
ncbi:MAG: DUF3429 family protein [Pseudomonadota bacterium]|nr:DUF3429 family protein [Pseudomonadota bacterium]